MLDRTVQRGLRYLLGLVTLALVTWGLIRIVHVLGRGPDAETFRLYVLFKDARGLRPGTRVLHRGTEVGQVATLALDAEAGRVRTHLNLDRAALPLVRTTTQIWIARPRFGGLTGEVSGLDTLIKESYLQLRSPLGGEPLAPGEELLGMESPPADLAEEALEDPEVGDLLASVLVPERHGLAPGCPVLFRGMPVGEVRRVDLTEDGRGVLVHFRVGRAARATVREKSRFWAARPSLQGSLLSGITIDDLQSLLAPALVYDAHDARDSEPATDDAVFIGLARPPETLETWEGGAALARPLASAPRDLGTVSATLLPWVEVRYRAIEEDWPGGDDEVAASGEGVLFRRGGGELYVLTGRSACDGEFVAETGFLDSLSLSQETLRVFLKDGRVFPARRVWVDPEGEDLALLDVQMPPGWVALPLPNWQRYLDFTRTTFAGAFDESRGDPVLLQDQGVAYGLTGRAKGEPEKRAAILFSRLPAEWRPEGP
ncbi:MAG: MlaD family protein [Planctomycetota bacterium]